MLLPFVANMLMQHAIQFAPPPPVSILPHDTAVMFRYKSNGRVSDVTHVMDNAPDRQVYIIQQDEYLLFEPSLMASHEQFHILTDTIDVSENNNVQDYLQSRRFKPMDNLSRLAKTKHWALTPIGLHSTTGDTHIATQLMRHILDKAMPPQHDATKYLIILNPADYNYPLLSTHLSNRFSTSVMSCERQGEVMCVDVSENGES